MPDTDRPDLTSLAAAGPIAADGRLPLIGLDKAEMTALAVDMGEKPYRGTQLFQWIYSKGARTFEDMTDVSKEFRTRLADTFTLERPKIAQEQLSEDGTRKWLHAFADGQKAEAVLIPEDDRGTLCISSQVGCTLTCRFCHTGTQRLVRNLTPGEILAQIMVARDALGEWPTPKDDSRRLTNIVLMGMGEPLYNFESVKKAMQIVMTGDGISVSRHRITLSTSGVVPEIARCGEELRVNLAISLHAANDDVRSQIMPINKKYPLKELMEACRTYPGVSNARRITFEYVMLKDINDSEADARALVALVKDVHCKFNLIPFNPWPGTPYECSDRKTIERFQEVMTSAGLTCPIRTPRGRDILAACGQLKTDSEKLSAKERRVQAEEAWAEKEAQLVL
ncbi:MAG: 23S rRNA (adenine(2503)-C(2))-methyltransferase RlmN [Rhodospirillaceae bacterium]|jgi:23S rRNA (adenine2503-C2)-methyltransferase|nr:23S rRNA (adenine(2503)-C(2))-methyltransferase RlmN [Rhodospirillaceae bacterium]MBT5240512.1 23S rRNA (adenine(2503)-C(2))-methyltransferase RlmN [Rhodospirillaceae bacterium]MBT5564923.1 23S rRNA (adenine(2503)-C(2))-methyltransferase RlmN [Rhodospirillaceae bacterium]MBT6090536.1 23S rRNA (adenine(2503)-C(2))-methyltransferase RlmN [Rhodospirillaceae bacterium]MBT6960832.1 23S rRNA (adenine(2503)-C(2))-methyltransferase RlmN [Rhodospirillaceae bacterium]